MQIQSLYDVYQTLPDSRTASGKRFNQAGVLALVTLALMAQQNSLRQISAWVAATDPALGARLGFRFNRMPSYGTIRRVLLHLNLAALRPTLAQWANTLTRTLPLTDAHHQRFCRWRWMARPCAAVPTNQPRRPFACSVRLFTTWVSHSHRCPSRQLPPKRGRLPNC